MKGNTHPSKAHPQAQAHPWRRPWSKATTTTAPRPRLTCADCESEPCRCRP